MISGLNSTGVDVADLRVLPAAVSRHLLKTHGYDAGFHVGVSHADPEMIQIRFFEQPGIQMTTALQKEIEKHFTRRELRRVAVHGRSATSPTRPACARATRRTCSRRSTSTAIRARGFRLVVDYGYSGGVVRAAAPARAARGRGGLRARVHDRRREGATPAASGARSGRRSGSSRRSAPTSGPVFDRAGERLFLVDEQAARFPSSRRCCSSCA